MTRKSMRIRHKYLLFALSTLLSCTSSENQRRSSSMAEVSQELICQLPKAYMDMEFPKEYKRFRPGELKLVGRRYAYIYQKDSVTHVLNMNGVEVEGDFEHWDDPLYCGFGVNWKYRDSTKFLRVTCDRSLATFIVTKKDGSKITYIDGKVAEDFLNKTYPIRLIDGMYTVDTTAYVLTKMNKIKRPWKMVRSINHSISPQIFIQKAAKDLTSGRSSLSTMIR